MTLTYDFSGLGFEGLKFLVGWGQGFDAIDALTRTPEPDRDVLNLRLEYDPSSGPLEGLQVHLYYADERLLGAKLPREDQTQFRAIVNYSVPFL